MAQGVTYDGTPLMITNVGDEPIEVSLRFNALRKTEPPIIYYNTTGKKSYKKWDLSNITLAKGETLYLFGENSVVDSTFVVNGNSSIHLDGKLEALLQEQVGTTQFGNYALEALFKDVTQLESVGDIMPQVIGGINAPSAWSTGYRYSSLFENTGIVEIPVNFLKETDIGNPHIRLYNRMFFGCTKLTTIPRDLFINQSSVSTVNACNGTYHSMFQNCYNLEVAADVYVQLQGFMSAYGMYRGCKKITDVKVFTKTLASNHCMQYFVADCDNLQSIDFDIDNVANWGGFDNAMLNCKNLTKVSIKVKTWKHGNSNTNNSAYSDWMKGVSPTGTFICPKKLAEATDGYYDEEGNFVAGVGRGVNTVPEGWTIDYPIIDARDGDANAMALMAVISQLIHADGTPWTANSLVMMKSEAEKVTSIGTAFKGNTEIKDFSAFKYFTSVTIVPKEAFRNCKSLQTIVIPNSVTKIDGYNSDGAFMGASSLSNVQLSNRLKEIGRYAFYACSSLTNINLPDTLEKIDYYALYLTGLETIHIPKMVKDIAGASLPVKQLKEITIDNNNATYDSRNNCNAVILKSKNSLVFGCCNTIIPDDVVYIGANSFTGVTFNTDVTFPNALTSIGKGAFKSCTINNDIVLPQSVTTISWEAFAYCKLKSFTITDGSACYIDDYAFREATFKDMYIPSGVSYFGMTGPNPVSVFGHITVEGTLTILVKYFAYRLLNNSKVKNLILNQDEIISIGFQALAINNSYYSGNLTELYFPNLETIDDYAFHYVYRITKIRFGNKVTNIGKNVGKDTCRRGFELEATIPPTLSGELTGGQNWYVPRSAQAAYEAAPYWSDLNAAGKLLYLEDL